METERYVLELTKEEQRLLYSSVEYSMGNHKEDKELYYRILDELSFNGMTSDLDE
jgi:hypothetical protein